MNTIKNYDFALKEQTNYQKDKDLLTVIISGGLCNTGSSTWICRHWPEQARCGERVMFGLMANRELRSNRSVAETDDNVHVFAMAFNHARAPSK